MKKMSTQALAACGVLAALYTASALALGNLGFGPVQFRVSEALTVLPVFGVIPTIGVTLGCALTNALGVSMGLNILGWVDVFVGTAATFIAALMTRRLARITWKGIPWLAPLPPVLVNALIIGAELAFAAPEGFSIPRSEEHTSELPVTDQSRMPSSA